MPTPSSSTAPATASAPDGAASAEQAPSITVEKKKKKYSKGLPKAGQKAEVAVTKGVQRLARAVEEGIGVWRDRREVSAGKRRDGAIRDAVKNYGKAVTKLHKVAAKVPEDLSKALPSLRRVFRP